MSRRILILFTAALAQAAVTRVEVTQRTDMPQFNYQQITAKVYFAVDPKLPANKIIVDLDRAPRNAQGMVEFSSDLVVMRPKDPAKSNGTALLEISNRGGKGMVNMFDLAGRGDPGDPLLYEAGYTLVWVGWEFDVPDRTGMKLYAPVIKGITGPVRSEIMMDRRAMSASLGDRAQIPYAVADQASATMTVRDGVNTARTTIPRDQWNFNGRSDSRRVSGGFEPGEDLRSRVHGEGSRRDRPRSRCDSRLHLLYEAERRGQARDRVRNVAERTVPAQISVRRLQRG